MSIKFYDHKRKNVCEIKDMGEKEYANVIRYLHKYNWNERIIDGEEVWVSSKANLNV